MFPNLQESYGRSSQEQLRLSVTIAINQSVTLLLKQAEQWTENQLKLLFDGSTFISFDGLLCFLPLNVTDNIKNNYLTWWVEKNLNLSHETEDRIIICFENRCGEVWTSYNIQTK